MRFDASKVQHLCSLINTSYSGLLEMLANHYCAEYIKASRILPQEQIPMDGFNQKMDSGEVDENGMRLGNRIGAYDTPVQEMLEIGLTQQQADNIYLSVKKLASRKAENIAKAMFKTAQEKGLDSLMIREFHPANKKSAFLIEKFDFRPSGTEASGIRFDAWCDINISPELSMAELSPIISEIYGKALWTKIQKSFVTNQQPVSVPDR